MIDPKALENLAAFATMARVLAQYRECLETEGFTREEAIQLTISMQIEMIRVTFATNQ